MLKLRLTRTGRKKRPAYRIVVAEHTAPRDGGFVERLGYYDPLTDPATVEIKSERILHWLSKGAQPTETVHRLLAAKGLMAPPVTKPMSKKTLAKKQAAAAKAAEESVGADGSAPAAASAPAASAPAADEPAASDAGGVPAEAATATATAAAERAE